MNDWYYWTKNQYTHFIVFRGSTLRELHITTARVTQVDDGYQFRVRGPSWSAQDEKGTADTLDQARQQVDQRVLAIITGELRQEYMPYFG